MICLIDSLTLYDITQNHPGWKEKRNNTQSPVSAQSEK